MFVKDLLASGMNNSFKNPLIVVLLNIMGKGAFIYYVRSRKGGGLMEVEQLVHGRIATISPITLIY